METPVIIISSILALGLLFIIISIIKGNKKKEIPFIDTDRYQNPKKI